MSDAFSDKLSGLRVCMLVSNDLSIDARVRKEAQALADTGAEVTIIGVGENVPTDIAEDAPYKLVLARPSLNGKPLQPEWGREHVWYPVRVFVNKTITTSRQNRYQKQADEAGYSWTVSRPDMVATASGFSFDVVHAHDLDTLYAAHEIAKQNGAKLVYDSHELYLELHYLQPKLRVQFAEVQASIFPKIDALVSVSHQIADRLCEQYSRSDLEPTILFNGGVRVVDQSASLSTPVKLFFQGAFAKDRNLVELVEAMKFLNGKATLTLQGWGSDEQAIQDTIKRLDLADCVEVIPPCPPLEVVDSAANYDVGIINSLPKDENFLVTLPNKLFDYMCAGLAVASTDLPPIKEILERENCGVTYSQMGVDHTANALIELIDSPSRIQAMKNASLAAAPKYAWPAQAEKLVTLYSKFQEEIRFDAQN